jgi:hypothetical protein
MMKVSVAMMMQFEAKSDVRERCDNAKEIRRKEYITCWHIHS